jgi:cysteinyl-tRNA synthetase
MVDGKKMSKSLGNFYTLDYVAKKGIDLLSLRYFYLSAQYRKSLNFTWDALQAANNAYGDLISRLSGMMENSNHHPAVIETDYSSAATAMKNEFIQSLEDDLNTPNALAVLWRTIKSDTLIATEKLSLIHLFDSLLGLKLYEKAMQRITQIQQNKSQEVPTHILELVTKRQQAKDQKQFDLSDRLRKEIESAGYKITDKKDGASVEKI